MVADDYPLVWSEPHFYQSDYQHRNDIVGLYPNEALHRTAVSIESVGIYSICLSVL